MIEKLATVDTYEEKTFEPNLDYTSKKLETAVFCSGIVISCFAESILIGYALNLPQLYYYDVLGSGFFTAVVLLVIGNLLLLLDWKLKKLDTTRRKNI